MDELELYTRQIGSLIARVVPAVEGLDATQLNWRPAPEMNSTYIIAAHMLGNIEAWTLGTVCGQDVDRDRVAEFSASGADGAELAAAAGDLKARVEAALGALAPGVLGEIREPLPLHWGTGTPRPLSVRQLLLSAIVHNASHAGHLEVTRELAVANAAHGG